MSSALNDNFKYSMVIETSDYLHRLEANQFNLFTQKLHNGISKTLRKYQGQIIRHNDNTYLAEFDSVTDAILCALKIQSNFKYITPKFDKSIRYLKIGIAQGHTKSAQTLATRMCEVVKDQIVISLLARNAYEKENRNTFINSEHIRTLNHSEKDFLTNLMNYTETVWKDADFSVPQFAKPLNYSNSQVYRKLLSLTGKVPSTFIREYRLNRAMHLMHYRKGNITEIAKLSGFKSAAYFSKCFKDKFRLLPSKYLQQHAT
jgi:AraC-like DNA-binding protein